MAENWTTSKQRAKDVYQPQNLLKQYQKSKCGYVTAHIQALLAPTRTLKSSNQKNNLIRFGFIQSTTHCVKSVQIRSFFWSVFSYIRPEYRKIRTRKNSIFGHSLRSDDIEILDRDF